MGDHLWSTPGNWFPEGAPVSGDHVILGDFLSNGRNSGFTVDDITNLVINGFLLGSDADHFTLESTVGGVVIDGALEVDHANADVGLAVQCPVTIINGGFIANYNQNGSTKIVFNNDVFFETPGGGPRVARR